MNTTTPLRNRIATVSLSLSMAAILLLFYSFVMSAFADHVSPSILPFLAAPVFGSPIFAIVGVITGHVARRRAVGAAGAGADRALAGLIVGYFALCMVGLLVLGLVVILAAGPVR